MNDWTFAPVEEPDTHPPKRQRKWIVDRTINLPTVGAVVTALFYLIVWGKGLEAAVSHEQSARIRMEQAAEKERVAAKKTDALKSGAS
mgnify:CR=1 FL=1